MTATVDEPVVEPAPRSWWRRQWDRRYDRDMGYGDRIWLARKGGWGFSAGSTLVIIITTILMFLFMYIVVMPTSRAFLVPFFEGFFGIHGWWWMHVITGLLAFCLLVKTAVVTGLSTQEEQGYSSGAFAKWLILTIFACSIPLTSQGYVNIPDWSEWWSTLRYNVSHVNPSRGMDVRGVGGEAPPQASVCPPQLDASSCSKTFTVTGSTIAVKVTLSDDSSGQTMVTCARGNNIQTYPWVPTSVETNVSDDALLLVSGEDKRTYTACQHPKA